MNNIYVEKTPETCEECSCCYYDDYAECYKCPLLLDNEINIYDKDSDCPLKPLADRLAEERKKVVQELKNWCDKNFNWVADGTGYDGQDYNEMIGSNNTINKLREILDQIERGEV